MYKALKLDGEVAASHYDFSRNKITSPETYILIARQIKDLHKIIPDTHQYYPLIEKSAVMQFLTERYWTGDYGLASPKFVKEEGNLKIVIDYIVTDIYYTTLNITAYVYYHMFQNGKEIMQSYCPIDYWKYVELYGNDEMLKDYFLNCIQKESLNKIDSNDLPYTLKYLVKDLRTHHIRQHCTVLDIDAYYRHCDSSDINFAQTLKDFLDEEHSNTQFNNDELYNKELNINKKKTAELLS